MTSCPPALPAAVPEVRLLARGQEAGLNATAGRAGHGQIVLLLEFLFTQRSLLCKGGGVAGGGSLFTLALKPGLFPLPRLRRLLFLQAAFHSGFNSLQTLPNGFFTRGPPSTLRHGTGFQGFHAPLGRKKKGGSFSHTSPRSLLGAAPLAPRTPNGVGRGVGAMCGVGRCAGG